MVAACAAFAHHVAGEPHLALQQSERAVVLNRNDPFCLYARACALTYGGAPEEALEWYAQPPNPSAPGMRSRASIIRTTAIAAIETTEPIRAVL